MLISSSKVKFHGKTLFLNNTNSKSYYLSTVSAIHEGGAITCLGSTVHFFDLVNFVDNYSRKNGGALSAIGSKIYAHADILVAKNQAEDNGGGIYLFISHFICEISCNFSENNAISGYGGGIYAVDSIVFLGNESDSAYLDDSSILSLIFRSNRAARGGGIYFEANSEIRGPKETNQSYKILLNLTVIMHIWREKLFMWMIVHIWLLAINTMLSVFCRYQHHHQNIHALDR